MQYQLSQISAAFRRRDALHGPAARRAVQPWLLAGLLLLAAGLRPARAAADAPAPDAPVMEEKDAAGSARPANGMFLDTAIAERLQVADPFLELHTGPGRGYPVFFVVERGSWVGVQSRHTDWYKVLTEDGKVGWVERAQLDSTLTAAGSRKSFRDIVIEDYLHRRAELGAAWGHFSGSPMLKVWTAYQLTDSIAVELTRRPGAGAVFGHQFLECRPAARAVVGSTVVTVLRHRRGARSRTFPVPASSARSATTRRWPMPGSARATTSPTG